ncbi:hypothetical protein [Streptosporangium roseum]|uniref:Lipoprotein n=1 Tax=Streptosporangium roseum (strain ATCC 12428 / DSM 43021 / JCM 3005 / KCTC 9067 / NCIMB 10171 / NRRL 2505 / NI 9100) TaxID=479432 RepID=D2B2G7_STRRD|nr:hypothetical protein [Streptosporangium roseum]ACZ91193.1 hypothetical protein Sros_8551 [Streptosporangium roseum DSM 43021]
MSRALTAAPAVALAAAVLTGCGAEPAALMEPAAPSQDRRRQMEAAIGDCMKQKGFKYNPDTPPSGQKTDEESRREAGDYEALRKHREKYGFGIYTGYAYPGDKQAGGVDFGKQDPNNPIMMALSRVQLESWRATRDTCYSAAVKKFTGKTVRSEFDLYEQAEAAREQVQARELDGDARLLDLAAEFGDCLKTKGVKVRSLKPTAVASANETALREEMYALGEKQRTDRGVNLPDRIRTLAGEQGDTGSTVRLMPSLSPGEAMPYLAREVKIALDDLECGRDFYAAFKPRQRQIYDRVNREFGRGDGPAS